MKSQKDVVILLLLKSKTVDLYFTTSCVAPTAYGPHSMMAAPSSPTLIGITGSEYLLRRTRRGSIKPRSQATIPLAALSGREYTFETNP